ncbi:MFS transporter [Bremerella cremea]|uniref:MFS transporter n=1 Tax=Bremerella cremea TaxID=1031537 RepID=A0A368KPQ6_9BACT|nr:sugar porter family MFS transporter [Bremerella cremea]RCS41490.1 MFS transporter [Bremerella cremea]
MKNRVILWSVTASLAGFLFGFDTVVISGAEKTIQGLWELSKFEHGLAISAALWGTVIGAGIGGVPTDKFGRRKTLISIGILYFVSAIWSGLATDFTSFMLARFIGGVGVGISTVASPLYISEISPPGNRGKLAGMFQFNIVFGILIAFVSNYTIAQIFPDGPDGEPSVAWRWMLGIEALPALIYSLLCFSLPESPRWLIAEKGDRAAGIEVLQQVMPDATEEEVQKLTNEIETAAQQVAVTSRFWSRRLMLPITLAFLIAFFNQLSGINAILYFSIRIFELAGMENDAALLKSIGLGITNLIFTFVGLALIDRLGRKTLMIIGSLGYIASLGLCAWAFHAEQYAIVAPCLFAFIAAHAIGQGAVIWVFISEIFPNRYRAKGQALGSETHWVFAAALTLVFPYVVETFPTSTIFGFFCGMMVLQLVWVLLMMPETKGVPLEEIERKLGIHE